MPCFAVHRDFHKAKGPMSFDGTPKGAFVGFHAMLIIGARRDDTTGKRWFLLQNWWKEMQFVEVSDEYLGYCCKAIYFVPTPQPTIREEFPTNRSLFVEDHDVDKPESTPLAFFSNPRWSMLVEVTRTNTYVEVEGSSSDDDEST